MCLFDLLQLHRLLVYQIEVVDGVTSVYDATHGYEKGRLHPTRLGEVDEGRTRRRHR